MEERQRLQTDGEALYLNPVCPTKQEQDQACLWWWSKNQVYMEEEQRLKVDGEAFCLSLECHFNKEEQDHAS